jgi:hypothetical protein
LYVDRVVPVRKMEHGIYEEDFPFQAFQAEEPVRCDAPPFGLGPKYARALTRDAAYGTVSFENLISELRRLEIECLAVLFPTSYEICLKIWANVARRKQFGERSPSGSILFLRRDVRLRDEFIASHST